MRQYYSRIPFIQITISLIMLLNGRSAFAQPEITGPRCILPGISYQYLVSGNWKAGTNVNVCVTGGKLKGDSTCTPKGSIPFMLFVTWDAANGKRQIELNSDAGKATLSVLATEQLQGGVLDANDRSQIIDNSNRNYVFHCKASQGGNCSPNYIYQWQYSENSVEWRDIVGATAKDLQISGSRSATTYVRRLATETNSNTMAYSDQGVLAVVL